MTKEISTKLSTSPDRDSFTGSLSESDDRMQDFYRDINRARKLREEDPEWAKDNLEYDLRTSVKMVEQVRANKTYAQHLYAAMCNRDFQRNDTWPRLTDQHWSCSWRYAGGIIADMRGEGDYMDWYCSGIRGGDEPDVYAVGDDPRGHVPEGVVTDEIRADLFELGWLVIDEN